MAPHDALRILFNWFDSIGGTSNTNFLSSSYPGFTQRILKPIKAPSVDEIVFSLDGEINASGYSSVAGSGW